MMEVGFSEILLISVLALIVLGPEKLPKVAAEIGRWVGRARSMARQFREQLEDEASLEPSHRPRGAAAGAAAAATTAATTAVSTAEAVSASELPAEPAVNLATELVPDHAELTPHAPMEDSTPDPVAEYVDAHAATSDAAAADDLAPNTRLPRP